MALKLKTGMIFLVIALCALVGVASAATGTGAGVTEEAVAPIMPAIEEPPLAVEEDETDVVEGNETVAVEGNETVAVEENATGEEVVAAPVDTSVDGQLLSASQKLSADMTETAIDAAVQDVYNNVNGAVMVYVINARGVIEAVYPDEYSAAVGDFIGRSAVGGVVLKAREFTETKEYTSAREGITGYDAVQPIISSDGKYLGAIVAKISS